MNINTKARQKGYSFLIVTLLIAFIWSYAVSSIVMYSFLAFIFFDNTKKIKEKLRVALNDRLIQVYILFFLAQIVGLFYSENISAGIRQVEIMLPLLFVPMVIRTEFLEKKLLLKLLKTIKLVVPLSFVILLIYHLLVLGKGFNTFVHYTVNEELGVSQFYLAFILLISIIECIRQISIRHSTVQSISVLVFNLVIVLLLGNRTTLLFCFVLVVIVIIRGIKKSRKTNGIFLLLLIFTIGLGLQLSIVNEKINVLLKTTDFNLETIITKNKFTITKNTLEHRILLDYLSLKSIRQSLPFGFGTGDYLSELYKNYEEYGFKAAIYYKFNAHNQYLEEFLKTGFLGGILFIVLIVLLLQRMQKTNYYIYLVLFFAFACLFESYLSRQHGVMILGFIIPFVLYNTKNLK